MSEEGHMRKERCGGGRKFKGSCMRRGEGKLMKYRGSAVVQNNT